MAARQGNNDLRHAAHGERPSAAQELYLHVYHRCILQHLSVLDTEIFMLTNGYSRSGMLDEIEDTRAKRERIYKEFQRNLQQLHDVHNGDGNSSSAGAQAKN